MKKSDLLSHFTSGLNPAFRGWIGSEVETHFTDGFGNPICLQCSQEIFRNLVRRGWEVSVTKGALISELKKDGAKVLYELGRQNIELSVPPCEAAAIVPNALRLLQELYSCASEGHRQAFPFFGPIMETDEDVLVIPDERDASWLELDGRMPLGLLARTASVQFTLDARDPGHAIEMINRLARQRDALLRTNSYPQESYWRRYITDSKACYRPDRYGIVSADSVEGYVDNLARHDAVIQGALVPFDKAAQDIDLFLRSIWWNFRLRRYGDRLCVEIRTLARRTDAAIARDLNMILGLVKY